MLFNKLSHSSPIPRSLSLSTAYSSFHVAISSSHHHYWGPFVWRSYLSSSPAWIHPLASSSQMTPSCRWPDRPRERAREKEGERQGWVEWVWLRWGVNRKWIQASRDPLRRLSRTELKLKNKVTVAFKTLSNTLSKVHIIHRHLLLLRLRAAPWAAFLQILMQGLYGCTTVTVCRQGRGAYKQSLLYWSDTSLSVDW